jgi:hypothetical protein
LAAEQKLENERQDKESAEKERLAAEQKLEKERQDKESAEKERLADQKKREAERLAAEEKSARLQREVAALRDRQDREKTTAQDDARRRVNDLAAQHQAAMQALTARQGDEVRASQPAPLKLGPIIISSNPTAKQKREQDALAAKQARELQELTRAQTAETDALSATLRKEARAMEERHALEMKALLGGQGGVAVPTEATEPQPGVASAESVVAPAPVEERDEAAEIKALIARVPEPPTDRDVAYVDGVSGIGLKRPANFTARRQEVGGGTIVFFSPPRQGGATDFQDNIRVSCNILPDPRMTLADLYNKTVLAGRAGNTTAKYSPAVKTTLGGAEALAFTAEQVVNGEKLQMAQVQAIINGKVVFFILNAKAHTFEQHKDSFRRMWLSLSIK